MRYVRVKWEKVSRPLGGHAAARAHATSTYTIERMFTLHRMWIDLGYTYRDEEGVEAEGRRKAEAPLTSRQAAAATAGIERAIVMYCV